MPKEWNCIHRGEKVAERQCGACGSRGKITDVFRCEIHKYCSLQLIRSGGSIKFCKLCQDIEGPDGEKFDD